MTDRAFQLLGLFSLERPAWTVDQIAPQLGIAVSSAYRLIGRLSSAGLVDAITPGRYVLGPAIIQFDRQIQLTDPLVHAARPVMDYLIGFAPQGSTVSSYTAPTGICTINSCRTGRTSAPTPMAARQRTAHG